MSIKLFVACQSAAHCPSLGLIFLIHVTMVWGIPFPTFQRPGYDFEHEIRKKLQNIVSRRHKNKNMAEIEHFVSGVFSPLK